MLPFRLRGYIVSILVPVSVMESDNVAVIRLVLELAAHVFQAAPVGGASAAAFTFRMATTPLTLCLSLRVHSRTVLLHRLRAGVESNLPKPPARQIAYRVRAAVLD